MELASVYCKSLSTLLRLNTIYAILSNFQISISIDTTNFLNVLSNKCHTQTKLPITNINFSKDGVFEKKWMAEVYVEEIK